MGSTAGPDSPTRRTEENESDGNAEFLVGTTTDGALVTIEGYAHRVRRVIDLGSIGDVVVCELPTERDPDLLTEIPGVDYVERNGTYCAVDRVPTVSSVGRSLEVDHRSDSWGIDRINARDVRSSRQFERRPEIGVLDTGIDPDHEALTVVDGVAFEEVRNDCGEPWADDRGHGTHVTGIATADRPGMDGPGVHPEADLHAVKVLDEAGQGSFDTVAAGVQWAVEQELDVLVLGFSGSRRSRAVRDACRHAVANGTLIVAAAGNSGPLENSVGYPAGFDSVVAVAAIDRDDEIAQFSSRGTPVEFAAPGVDVLTTSPDDGYETVDGTSMAAPFIAGTAAAVMARGLDPDATRQLLRTHAEETDIDRDRRGYGVVDLQATLAAVPDEPTARTGQAEVDVTDGTATLNGRIVGPGDSRDGTVWFDWRRDDDRTWRSTPARQIDQSSFSTELTDLEQGRSYRFRARAEINESTVSGSPESFSTGDELTIETAIPTVLGPSAVTLRGRPQHFQGGEQVDVWIEYREQGTEEWHESTVGTVSRPRFASRIDGLEPDTVYEFRVNGRVGTAVDVGSTVRARTDQSPETVVETAVACETAETELTLRGRVRTTDEGGDANAWFEYRARGADEWRTTDRQEISPGKQYKSTLTGLRPRTIYEFRAVCEGSETRDVGDPYTVRTDRRASNEALTVETAAPASVGPTSLTIGGRLRSDYDVDPATMYLEYRLTGFRYWHRTEQETVTPGDRIDHRVDDLAPAATYEYRVVAQLGDRTVCGTVRTATTASVSSVPRHVVLNCYSPTEVRSTSVTIDADVRSIVGADAAEVWMEYRAVGDEKWNRTGQTTVGTFERYDETIDGLDPDTTYEIRAATETVHGYLRTAIRSVTTENDSGSARTLAVTAYSPMDVGPRRITLTGSIRQLNGSHPVDLRLELRPEGGDDWQRSMSTTVSHSGLFTRTVGELEPDRTYEYRMVAETEDQQDVSSTRTVKTERIGE
jgi:subtilisin